MLGRFALKQPQQPSLQLYLGFRRSLGSIFVDLVVFVGPYGWSHRQKYSVGTRRLARQRSRRREYARAPLTRYSLCTAADVTFLPQ